MHFDIRTLLVAVALATTFCAAARLLLWRMHPHVPGLRQWAEAGVLAAGALFLVAAHRAVPAWASLSLAQALMTAGMLLAWDGFRRFLGQTPLPRLLLVALPLAPLATVVFLSALESSVTLRTLINAGTVALVSALIARDLLRAPRPPGAVGRVIGYIYLTNAAVFGLRWLSAIADATGHGLRQPDDLLALSLLWWLCVTMAVTLGMTLMTGERLQGDLDRLASRDPLTGALNRRAFALVAEKEVAHARRSGRPLAVLMMDLDHFKRINDDLGHAAGDDILCRFVAVAGRILRGEDVFCRFGGEEFVALLPETDGQQALAAAERLRAAFAAEFSTFPAAFAFTASIGIGEMRADETLEDTLRRADAALYRAKATGRNCCELAA
ncbi:MAG: diguanylate cyclase [Bacteroidota bacterium]